MNVNMKIILALCCLCMTFVAGYLAGNATIANSNNIETQEKNELTAFREQIASSPNSNFLTPESAVHSSSQSSQNNLQNNATKNTSDISLKLSPDQIEKDIIVLFQQFMAYTASGSDFSDYGKKLDDIRTLLLASSSDLAILLEYFQQVPIDSKESYMLVSILMGLPQEISHAAMLSVMEASLSNDSSDSAVDFLELAARTGLKSPSINASLTDIAIYSENNDHTLRALDMLMPYEVSLTENQQIRERLLNAAQSSETEDRPYYFSQLLRFSNASQRKQLVLDAFKQTEANKGIQSVIMDSIQSGILDRSNELKEVLYHIATQPENELQQQAIYTLLYRFDLTQQEYRDLNEGKTLE